jgi:molybdopterin-guanine dinucleotide biosynthesis protein A
VTAIVLAGGRSTRFGADKLATAVAGEPLLHRAVRAVAATADEVIVVIGPDAPAPVLPADLPAPVRLARDRELDRGPLAGLVAGLAVASAPAALLVAGDQPWLQPDVLRLLLEELDGPPGGSWFDVVALHDGDSLWPFPVALRVATVRPAAEAALAARDLRLFTLFRRLRVARVPEASWRALDPDGASLRDIDTHGDLAST